MSAGSTVMVQDGAVSESSHGEPLGTGSSAPVEEQSLPCIEFVGPIPGFPDHRKFLLVELDEAGLLCSLQSLEDPGLRFLVLPPGPFFPDYEPEISDDWAEQLEISDPQDALVLLVITTGASAAEATANLLAPIVINLRTRRAAQVVLEETSLPLRAPLRPAK